MKNMDKKKQQTIDEIVERASKEMNALTDIAGEVRAGGIYSIKTQIKILADKMGISRDVMLLVVSNSILQSLLAELKPSDEEKKPEPAMNIYKPPKDGYMQ